MQTSLFSLCSYFLNFIKEYFLHLINWHGLSKCHSLSLYGIIMCTISIFNPKHCHLLRHCQLYYPMPLFSTHIGSNFCISSTSFLKFLHYLQSTYTHHLVPFLPSFFKIYSTYASSRVFYGNTQEVRTL